MPGANNDLNVFARSNVFEDPLHGITPPINYEINRNHYDMGYYLVMADALNIVCAQSMDNASAIVNACPLLHLPVAYRFSCYLPILTILVQH